MNTTIKDVAREAGVSVGSVHLAINNKPGISEKNKQHIMEVANRLGYKPNMLASNLKRVSRNIAVVLPRKDDRSIYYYDYMWKAIEDFESIAKDYNLKIIKYEYTDFSKTLNDIDLSLINGLITVGYPESHYKDAITRVSGKKIPIILIDSDFEDLDILCCMQPNTRIIGRLTAELLLNTIHRLDGKILVCGGDKNYPNHYEIVNAINEYFEEQGIINRTMEVNFMEVDSEADKLISDILRENNIVGCCSVNSRSTVAITNAITKNGLAKRIPVIGNGLFEASIDELKKGTITAIINKRPYEQCFNALVAMSDLLVKNINPKERIVNTGVDVVFKSLLEQYEKNTFKI